MNIVAAGVSTYSCSIRASMRHQLAELQLRQPN